MAGSNFYRQLIDEKVAGLARQYDKGEFSPYIIAADSIALPFLLATIVSLRYFESGRRRYIRFLAFALILMDGAWIIGHVRFLSGAYGYGIGLVFSVGIMNSAALLIFNDPISDFKRLEHRRICSPDRMEHPPIAISSSLGVPMRNGIIRDRSNANGHADRHSTSVHTDELDGTNAKDTTPYHWQSSPASFWHQLDWAFDLMTSFRGAGWSWRIRPLGPFNQYKSSEFPVPASRNSKRKFYTEWAIYCLVYYLLLDALKVIFMYDPYFLGIAPLSSPIPRGVTRYLPFLENSICSRIYRLCLTAAGVLAALNFIYTLGPLFYGLVLPKILPHDHWTPLGEPFLWPPFQHSFMTVLDEGLAGWWGKFWHQMFRFGASEPGKFAVQKLSWDPRSIKSRILQVTIAFFISASIHFAGSYTIYDDTKPWDPFLFFLLQGIGVLTQTFITKILGTNRLPRWLRRTGNLLVVMLWGYYTGPLFTNDLARSGLWLFEPIPISPLRGLGFGLEGESWWCWQGKWFIWWDGRPGDPWWRKGWAIA